MPKTTPELVIGDIVKRVLNGDEIDDAIQECMPALRELVRYRAERPSRLAEMWAAGKSIKEMAQDMGLTYARTRELCRALPTEARTQLKTSSQNELAAKIFAAMREGQSITSLVISLGVSRHKIEQTIEWANEDAARQRDLEQRRERARKQKG